MLSVFRIVCEKPAEKPDRGRSGANGVGSEV